MDLSDLIATYGNENVQFQNLDECAGELKKTKNGTTVKFGTPQSFNFNGLHKLGLVLWLDRDRVKEILGAAKDDTNG
jgi:hypothetical protein